MSPSEPYAPPAGLCALPELHTVDLGILTVKGVYKQFDSCTISSADDPDERHECTLVNPGIGLVNGDFLMIKNGTEDCTSTSAVPNWP